MKKIILSVLITASIFAAKTPTKEDLAQKSLDAFGYGIDNGLKNIALASYPYIPQANIRVAKINLGKLGVPADQIPPHMTELEKDPALLKTATRKVLTNHADLIGKADMECKATK